MRVMKSTRSWTSSSGVRQATQRNSVDTVSSVSASVMHCHQNRATRSQQPPQEKFTRSSNARFLLHGKANNPVAANTIVTGKRVTPLAESRPMAKWSNANRKAGSCCRDSGHPGGTDELSTERSPTQLLHPNGSRVLVSAGAPNADRTENLTIGSRKCHIGVEP